jgi:hypothetical protein
MPGESRGLCQIVVGLSHSLRPEAPNRGWEPSHVQIRAIHHASARSLEGPDQFKILEQDVAVVSTESVVDRAADYQGSGMIDPECAVQERSSLVPGGMPWHWVEEILRAQKVSAFHGPDGGCKRLIGVPDVIVGDHHDFLFSEMHPGANAPCLAVERP